tara:strand:- start:278 stop:1990 length:1713 start_codon:yes stop_codon:yes gene_type:complete
MILKSLNNLVDRNDKKFFFVIFLSIAISAILETISIAIFLPLFDVIFGGQLSDNYLIKNFNNFFNTENYSLTLLIFIIVMIFIFKNLIYLFLIYVKMKLINIFAEKKKSFLLQAYLDQKFFIFKDRSKPELIRNIYVEVDNFIDNFILPIIEFIYIILVLTFVLIFLYLYDAKITAIMFLSLVFLFLVFYSITKTRLLLYGTERAVLQKKILKKIPNALNGFFEIKLFGISKIVNNDFMKSVRRLNKIKIPQSVIGNIPRSFLEIFVISSFGLFLIFQVGDGEEIMPVIAKLSIYVVVIIKLMPFINGIASFYSKLMRGFVSFKILSKEFSNYSNISKTSQKVLNTGIQNITCEKMSYDVENGNNKRTIFKDVDLEIKNKDFLGVVGSSGSGKTTLLKLLTGILEPTKGKVNINQDNIQFLNKRSLYNQISYIPQDPFFLYDDIIKNITSSNILKEIDENHIKNILQRVQLEQFINNEKVINDFIGENASNLSGGERQRLAIARAFYKESSLLIFDEITNKLDDFNSKKIMDIINGLKGSKTIIIVTHELNSLTQSDYILNLENQKIIKK